MAIATATAAGTPFAKFRKIGDTLVGALASDPSLARRQRRDYSTQSLKFKDDGKPALEEVMDFVAMPGTTVSKGKDDEYSAIEPGEHTRFAVSGFKWGQVIEQRRGLPRHITVDPAGNSVDIGAGIPASGDVYTITLAGYSAATDNPAGAQAAGLTVVEGRIVMRTADEHEKWVIAQVKAGKNTNAAKDYEISIRRSGEGEKEWEAKADELFLTKPWERGGADSGHDVPDDQPTASTAEVVEEF